MEQNFGPHMEQKCATLADSLGSVSSWKARAVSGSRPRLNWSSQRNSKRALDRALSRICAPGCPLARSAAWAARSEEHTSELQSRENLVCRLLLEKKKAHATIIRAER